MDLELKGKIALVTGAARGIGAAIALKLAAEGCNLVLLDCGSSESTASACAAQGAKVRSFVADVADWKLAEQIVAEVVGAFGRLDILVCCAGITRDAMSWKMEESDWDAVLAVNLKGYFTYCRAAAQLFREQKSGKMVLIASINGLRGKLGQANYAAAKAGTVALTKTLAKELGRSQVNVNAVAPGLVETEMTQQIPKEAFDKAVAETVLGRAAATEDIADLVAFLCSPRARHITGEVIKVDGGQYI